MDVTGILAQLLNGVQYGLILFLIASGLTLVFGVMGIINLAHGSLFMVGAYAAFVITRHVGSLWLALPVGLVGGALLGMALERGLFRRFYAREHLDQVLLTYALILLFEEARSFLIGNEFYAVEVPKELSASVSVAVGFSYSAYRFFVIGVCLALAALLFLVIERTKLGAIIRAAAEKPDMVDVLGIDARRIYLAVFALGTALAVVAGMLAAPLEHLEPGYGQKYLIISFVVVVVGGLGSVSGAFWGALLIGLADTLGQVYLPKLVAWGTSVLGIVTGGPAPKLGGLVVYLLMAVVLLWRPSGLFGQRA